MKQVQLQSYTTAGPLPSVFQAQGAGVHLKASSVRVLELLHDVEQGSQPAFFQELRPPLHGAGL